jgi:hypothetical protein
MKIISIYCNDIAQNCAATNTVELLFLYHTLYKQKQTQTQTNYIIDVYAKHWRTLQKLSVSSYQ